MNETMKTKLEITFGKWMGTIDKKGFVEIDLARDFIDILARNIIHICFGEDLCDHLIDMKIFEDGKWKETKLNLVVCIKEIEK